MNILQRLAYRLSMALLPRSGQPSRSIWIGTGNTSGVHVDHDVAMTFGAVFSAVKVISESIGVLGFHRYDRQRDGGKRRMDAHPASVILNRQWNPYMTAQVGREVLTNHCLLYGNAYAEIQRDAGGQVAALWPLLPDRMFPRWEGERLVYRYLVQAGEYAELDPSEILHIKGLGYDGVQGYDVVTYMGRSIGHGIAAEQFAGSFFGNGAHLSGALIHPGTLTPSAKENLRNEFNKVYRGSRNALRMAVFEEGMDWKQFSTTPEAAQMIQTRKFSVTDIARWFRVPPHMLADLEKATFSNIEQQALEFVVHTLLPWVTRWEQECDVKLVEPRALGRGFHKLNISTLLRGDQKSRFEAYRVGREWGWLSANDVRRFEDMDPLETEVGDVYIVPLNFQRAEHLANAPQPTPGEPEPEPPEEPEPPAGGARSVLAQVCARMQAREGHGMAAIWGKSDFVDRCQRFFNRHAQVMAEELRPASALYATQQGAQEDDPRIDGLLHGLIQSWCDDRFGDWIQGARANTKPTPTKQADKLTDQLINILTGAFT